MRPIATATFILGLTAALLAATTNPHPGGATVPGYNGKIAFVRSGTTNGTLNDEILVMEPDGSNVINVTDSPENERAPAWSPDGTRIAFERNSDLWVMDHDGSSQVQLTDVATFDQPPVLSIDPAWSPDGTKIIFGGIREGVYGMYILELETLETTLFIEHGDIGFDGGAAWSPDGSRIAFGASDIELIDANGSNRVNLTNSAYIESSPSWSPDGESIVYTSSWLGIARRAAIPDGSAEISLAYGGDSPKWSPDGTRITYISKVQRGGHSHQEIFVMAAGGSGETQLTTSAHSSWNPDWQPLAEDPGTTPFPLATPTPTPGGLPDTGGPPGADGDQTLPLALAGIGAALVLATPIAARGLARWRGRGL